MTKRLPAALKANVRTLIKLLQAKGNPRSAYEIGKLANAVENHSSVIDTRVSSLLQNAFAPSALETDLTAEERDFIRTLTADLAEWRSGGSVEKPGPAKQFPFLIHLRIGTGEMEKLDEIQSHTDEPHSEIIRQAIRSAKVPQ